MFAAAALGDANGWDVMWCEDTERSIMQEDGSEKNEVLVEYVCLHELVTKGQASKGLWVGGAKYRVTRQEGEIEVGDYKVLTINAAKPGGGLVICVTPGKNIVVGLWKEEAGQNHGMCKNATLSFSETLCEMGY